LLKPKAGGVAFVLDAMGEHLTTLVDVTIYYPEGIPTFSDFLSGRIKKVCIEIHTRKIDSEFTGDYMNDRSHKIAFQKWLTQFWHEKDTRLENMKQNSTKYLDK
nr:acyltransferase [Colwellia sp.]